jgi:hypothetical protein
MWPLKLRVYEAAQRLSHPRARVSYLSCTFICLVYTHGSQLELIKI